MHTCICVHLYVVFSDSRMQVALPESREQDVYPEGKQISGGDDWYESFLRLEKYASSTIS